VIASQHRLQVEGQPTWLATLSGRGQEVSISFLGSWPAGTTATLGDATTQVPGIIRLQPYEALGDARVFRLDPAQPRADPSDIPVSLGELVVRLRNNVEMRVPLPPLELPYRMVEPAMQHAEEHGLTFRGEPAHQGPHTVYVDAPEGRSDRVVGPAATLREVDRIARIEASFAPGDGTMCSYIGGVRLPLELETQVVTVLDRRTGQQIAQRTFAATGSSCPIVALGRRAIIGPSDQVDAWLAELP
jgi:hypothetical protein